MTDDPEQPGGETRGGALPGVIHLPDQSQPPPKKRGRHFGLRPVEDPRSERIDLRVTPAQRAAMKDAAQEAGMSVAALICARTLGTAGPRAQRRPRVDAVVLTKVLAQLGKIGSNMNQIAHRLNEQDFEGIPELLAMRDEHREALAEHRAAVQAILEALGV
ncbi:MAG: plasmid mobilization relaxosome protein MobC [Acetobacteraceae bacterium]